MALELTRLLSTNQVSDIPAIINQAFEDIENALNPVLNVLNTTTKTINLSGLTGTLPNKSIIADNIILTGATGNVLVVSPDGTSIKASIDKDGNITPANKPTIEGTTDSEKLTSVIASLRTLGFVI